MSRPHALLRSLRLFHLYIGVFIAPALLFFAFTGALQTFSLHETTAGSTYKPPAWAVTLGQIHKKATPIVPAKKQQPPPAAAGEHHPKSDHADANPASDHDHATAPTMAPPPPTPTHNPLPLKIFFLLVAIGLVISTFTGLYMSWKFNQRNRWVLVALFLAGIIAPVTMVLV